MTVEYEYRETSIIEGVKIVTQADIDDALSHASTLKRLRMPINIHENYDEVPQRFVNCLNRETYIRPHRHTVPTQWEFKCWLSGEIVTLLFDEKGKITHRIVMNDKSVRIVEIPPLYYHTVFAMQSGSYLEIRNGVYRPPTDKTFSPWSPEENSPLAKAYQKRFFTAKVGDLLVL